MQREAWAARPFSRVASLGVMARRSGPEVTPATMNPMRWPATTNWGGDRGDTVEAGGGRAFQTLFVHEIAGAVSHGCALILTSSSSAQPD